MGPIGAFKFRIAWRIIQGITYEIEYARTYLTLNAFVHFQSSINAAIPDGTSTCLKR